MLVLWLNVFLGLGWGVGRVVRLGLVQIAVYSGQDQAAVCLHLVQEAVSVLGALLGVVWGVGRVVPQGVVLAVMCLGYDLAALGLSPLLLLVVLADLAAVQVFLPRAYHFSSCF